MFGPRYFGPSGVIKIGYVRGSLFQIDHCGSCQFGLNHLSLCQFGLD